MAGLTLAAPALAQPAPAPPANDDCLACHADPSATRADGRPVNVQAWRFGASSHGPLACVDCHADLATVKEYPHGEKLARVNCATCHDDVGTQYERGIHARSRAAGRLVAATCADCHGTHEIRSAKDLESKTNHLILASTCGRCHGDPRVIEQGGIEIGNVVMLFQDSIHGRALTRSGLVVAPNCSDCHGSHDIKRRTDADSSVVRAHVPATCGKCHAGVKTHYDLSVHGVALAKGNARAPTCQDCHTAHSIQRTDVTSWRLDVIRECGTCHFESIKTYRDTFHGQVTRLGFVRVAACADCHTAHDIHATTDARSSVSPARVIGTCRKCHPDANVNFVKYDPHANRHDRARNPMLFYAGRFMDALLFGVFVFFGIHTTMWFSRSIRTRKHAHGPATGAVEKPGADGPDGEAGRKDNDGHGNGPAAA